MLSDYRGTDCPSSISNCQMCNQRRESFIFMELSRTVSMKLQRLRNNRQELSVSPNWYGV